MLTEKKGKLKLGAHSKITCSFNCIKNTQKNGQTLLLLWGIETRINVFIDIEDYLNSVSIERFGLLNKIKQ